MIHGLQGWPLAVAAVLAAQAIRWWIHEKAPRISAWLFFLVGGLLTIGITPWLDSLAGLTAKGAGITVLIIVLILGATGLYLEGIRKHKYHRIRTPITCLAFGAAIPVGYADVHRLLHKAAQSPGKVGQSLGQAVDQIRSGHAAAATPHSQQMTVFLVGLACLVALIILAVSHEKRKKGSGSSSAASGSSGRRGSAAASSGRRPAAITSGKRR